MQSILQSVRVRMHYSLHSDINSVWYLRTDPKQGFRESLLLKSLLWKHTQGCLLQNMMGSTRSEFVTGVPLRNTFYCRLVMQLIAVQIHYLELQGATCDLPSNCCANSLCGVTWGFLGPPQHERPSEMCETNKLTGSFCDPGIHGATWGWWGCFGYAGLPLLTGNVGDPCSQWYLGLPGATSDSRKSWRSWLSMLPGATWCHLGLPGAASHSMIFWKIFFPNATWGYLGLPLTAGNLGNPGYQSYLGATWGHMELPGATSDVRNSWQSWFSIPPAAAWGYLAVPRAA